MKNLTITLLVTLTATLANASSNPINDYCGLQFHRQDSKVLSAGLVSELVENHNIILTSDLSGPVSLKISAFSKIVAVKNEANFFWHELVATGPLPKDITVAAVEALLKSPSAQIELVEDNFEITCSQNEQGTENNLRIILNYKGTPLDFHTGNLPVAIPL